MKKWIADKLFDLALLIDTQTIIKNARTLVFASDILDEASERMADRPKKRGRPLGSKNRPKAVKP
jgi:hypothetical protein